MRWLLLMLMLLALGGCVGTEFSIRCKGKGQMTVTANMGAGTIVGDCGEGFEYERKLVK